MREKWEGEQQTGKERSLFGGLCACLGRGDGELKAPGQNPEAQLGAWKTPVVKAKGSLGK
jgi:hypothetical protein